MPRGCGWGTYQASSCSPDWSYDPRARCWRLALASWTPCVERWPASLENVVRSIAPGRQAIAAPHLFADMQAAQDWCLREIARQAPGEA